MDEACRIFASRWVTDTVSRPEASLAPGERPAAVPDERLGAFRHRLDLVVDPGEPGGRFDVRV